MLAQIRPIAMMIALAVHGLGCASAPATSGFAFTGDDRSEPAAALVLAGGDFNAVDADRYAPGPEFARNDNLMGNQDAPQAQQWRLVEVRHREHLWTINARPREFSSTLSRTMYRAASP